MFKSCISITFNINTSSFHLISSHFIMYSPFCTVRKWSIEIQNQKNSHVFIREVLVRCEFTLGSPNAKRQNSKSADKAQLGLQVLAETTQTTLESWTIKVSPRITSISDIRYWYLVVMDIHYLSHLTTWWILLIWLLISMCQKGTSVHRLPFSQWPANSAGKPPKGNQWGNMKNLR